MLNVILFLNLLKNVVFLYKEIIELIWVYINKGYDFYFKILVNIVNDIFIIFDFRNISVWLCKFLISLRGLGNCWILVWGLIFKVCFVFFRYFLFLVFEVLLLEGLEFEVLFLEYFVCE